MPSSACPCPPQSLELLQPIARLGLQQTAHRDVGKTEVEQRSRTGWPGGDSALCGRWETVPLNRSQWKHSFFGCCNTCIFFSRHIFFNGALPAFPSVACSLPSSSKPQGSSHSFIASIRKTED